MLYRQDILAELEARLDRLDWEEYRDPELKQFLASRKDDDMRDGSKRKELLEELEKEMKVYGKYFHWTR